MRLRYYLRGLGLGVLIATVVLTVANADRHPLSDAEIRARAAELGMVDSDSIKLPAQDKTEPPKAEPESLKEDALRKDEEQSKAESAEKEMLKEEELTEQEMSPEEGSEKEEPESPKEDASSKGEELPKDEEEQKAEAVKEEPTEQEAPGAEKETLPEEKATAASAPVTIVIRGGSNSYSVSKDLAAAGLVENAEEYDNYLCNNGYSGSIRAGTYEIVPGTSGEEIAKMIAR